MNQRKPNKSLLYSLALALLLCAAILVGSTGTAYARYRTEQEKTITFDVRVPEQICLGTTRILSENEGELKAGTEVFETNQPLVWETVDGEQRLSFAVANGTSAENYSEWSQQIQIGMFVSLGAWRGDGIPKIELLLPPEADAEDQTPIRIQAMVSEVAQGTPLYQTNGGGWLLTFEDTEGALSWLLEGNQLSYQKFTVAMENTPLVSPTMITPIATGEVILPS